MISTTCGHDEAPRSIYTGTLCSPCYREVEIRLPGLAGYCSTLRRMAAPSSVSAVKLEERVQSSKEMQLPINEHFLELADNLYLAATGAVLETADLISTDPPYSLANADAPMRYRDSRATSFAAMSIESWLLRNLRWIAELDIASEITGLLTDALTEARRAVDPTPPRRNVQRTDVKCGDCLTGRITIEVRERGVFHSACGGCGKRGPVHARVVEAIFSAGNDGDGSGASDRVDDSDAVELQDSGPVTS